MLRSHRRRVVIGYSEDRADGFKGGFSSGPIRDSFGQFQKGYSRKPASGTIEGASAL
jgi:hypothetical protein